MIVMVDHDEGLRVRRVGTLDRLGARVRAARLDGELAAGASPESSVALGLRAERLTRLSHRCMLAHRLRRIVLAAEQPTPKRSEVPLCRDAVRTASHELTALADRLLAAGPVDARGVAKVRTLVTDGAGPLYRVSSTRDLRGELCAAMEAADLFLG